MSARRELFILPLDEGAGAGSLVYAPLRPAVARINDAAADAVRRFLDGADLRPDERGVIAYLEEHGFFEEREPPASVPAGKPVQVTLFLSDGCNLRCRYCYAGAAEQRHVMPEEVGRAAIDLVCGNAVELGEPSFVVGFHGNGEPFTAFPLMQGLCTYARECADRSGVEVRFSIATNGALDEGQRRFLADTFDSINISFDGLPGFQDRQRPLASGGGSFDVVDGTLRFLEGRGTPYAIRATATAQSAPHVDDILAFVGEHYPSCTMVHVEPLWSCGRCLQSGEEPPDVRDFIESFIRARDLVERKHGAGEPCPRIYFSSARDDACTDMFCSVGADGFTITAEGDVTACFEVGSRDDPRAGRFHYGTYDADRSGFVFDGAKRASLHRLSVNNMPFCADCFCKFSCSGDCPAKVLGVREPEEHRGSERCEITRALAFDHLKRTLRDAERVYGGEPT